MPISYKQSLHCWCFEHNFHLPVLVTQPSSFILPPYWHLVKRPNYAAPGNLILSTSCQFLPFMLKYSPKHTVLEHSQSVLSPEDRHRVLYTQLTWTCYTSSKLWDLLMSPSSKAACSVFRYGFAPVTECPFQNTCLSIENQPDGLHAHPIAAHSFYLFAVL
jgi:hypothetical protein